MAEKAQDAFARANQGQNDVLPRWNFSQYYPDGYDSPEYEADFVRLEQWTDDLATRFEGKLAELSGDQLADFIIESNKKDDLEGKLGVYVYLKMSQDSKAHSDAYTAYANRSAPLGAKDAYIGHEINQIPEARIAEMLDESEKLREYAPLITKIRQNIPHTPPLDVTKFMAEESAASGVTSLHGKLEAAKRFDFEGQELNLTEILTIFTDDPDQNRRKAAHDVFVKNYTDKTSTMVMAHLYNERIRLKAVSDKWHNRAQPWDSTHASNSVSTEMVDAMTSAVKDGYARTMHRFYTLKAALMEQDHLNIYDRNFNPLESQDGQAPLYIPFSEAEETIINAMTAFSPRMAAEAQQFFDNGWIDAPVDKNKRGGAYMHPGAARETNAWIMLNYKGTAGCVMTAAHELGHGVHTSLSAHKGDKVLHYPTTFAETASIFNEMLTFKSLVANAPNDDVKRSLLFDKINDELNSIYRQVSFHDFEVRIHTQFKETGKPLSEEDFANHFREALQESYGESIPLDEDYGHIYSYVSHMLKTPFYVYAYSFGNMLVNGLYGAYEEGNIPDFADKYVEMLEKSGTLTTDDLKTMFGLDIENPAFWQKGVDSLEAMIEELEVACLPLLEKKADTRAKMKVIARNKARAAERRAQRDAANQNQPAESAPSASPPEPPAPEGP